MSIQSLSSRKPCWPWTCFLITFHWTVPARFSTLILGWDFSWKGTCWKRQRLTWCRVILQKDSALEMWSSFVLVCQNYSGLLVYKFLCLQKNFGLNVWTCIYFQLSWVYASCTRKSTSVSCMHVYINLACMHVSWYMYTSVHACTYVWTLVHIQAYMW